MIIIGTFERIGGISGKRVHIRRLLRFCEYVGYSGYGDIIVDLDGNGHNTYFHTIRGIFSGTVDVLNVRDDLQLDEFMELMMYEESSKGMIGALEYKDGKVINLGLIDFRILYSEFPELFIKQESSGLNFDKAMSIPLLLDMMDYKFINRRVRFDYKPSFMQDLGIKREGETSKVA